MCLARHARGAKAEQTAMVFAAENAPLQSLSYRELDDLSARFAAALVSEGLKIGDRVLLRLPNIAAFPIVFFGALRAGMIPVPTSPYLKADEVNFLIKDSGARAIVSAPQLFSGLQKEIMREFSGTIFLTADNPQAALSFARALHEHQPLGDIYAATKDDPAYLVYTSGTTGYPKGVLHAHRSLLGRLPAATEWFCFADAPQRILHSGKFNWTYVLGTGMMDPLYHGKTAIVYEGTNAAERWLNLMRDAECDVFIGVPTIFRQILQKTDAHATLVPMLKHAMSAGEQLSDAVQSAWCERFGFPIYEGLGMSECSYYISQRKGDALKIGSAGKIQTGHRIDVLDENLESVPAGEEGMLSIHRDDPGLFLRYWSLDATSGVPLEGDWFRTGDYAVRDAEGYIYFMGRRDDIIKSFGYRISPFEIERVYRDHPAVADVVAFGEKIADGKTLIALCVQPKADMLFDGDALIQWGSERLASYKLPKKIYRLDNFPRSANGKVLRAKIAEVAICVRQF
ncbi:MAG: acyl-CoA synthetase [Spirochaetes bacterium]|nr:acyl-CoA synthetase [Spirochaetota bacterium]